MLKRRFDYKSRFRILKGGKISLVVSALLGSAVIASASPSGGTVTSGTANISQTGNTTNINQSSPKASINWNDFSIKSNETVNFNQPNSSSITLNRVVGNEKSVIDGALNANGQVWILNSNGILFNKSAKINTAGLLATTAELSDKDFQDGNYNFKNSSSNSVINLGTIKVQNSSYVVLAGNEVQNDGTIEAVKGKVHLVGANEYSINLNGNSLVNLKVNKGVLDALVKNSGTILADGGEIFLTSNAVNELLKGVVNNEGIIEANSLDEITGKVTITGEEINLKSGSKISATGTNGGGEVLVGGDWQGSGDLKQATKVTMESGSTIDASATQSGDGGKVVIWSDVKNADSVTEVHGTILAKGGSQSGNGGKIETSGHLLITDGVTGSAAANKGEAGTWLFDPTNVIIGSSGSTASGSNDGTSTLTASSIADLLNGGTSVMITTSSTGTDLGDLTVNSAITKSSGNNDVALTLRAANSIVINSDITNTGGSGKLNLIFDADNNANVATSTPSRDGGGIVILGSNLSTGGGSLTFGGTTSNGFTGGDLYIGGGSNAISLTTSGGALDVKGQLIIATSNASGVTLSTSGGNITLGGSVDSGNTYTAVSGTWTWDQAKNDADNVANSYLATITTRLENALAIRAAGYTDAWLGGQRISGTNLWGWVTDPVYNSSTNPMIFFYQGSSTQTQLGGTSSGAGGSTATGYYANWDGWTNGVASGEPNNWNNSVPGTFSNNYESVLQFTGSLGKWNDLSTSRTINQYVRETNLSPSKLTLNAGSGSVIINGAVGASKSLSSLDVTSSSTQVNGSAIITTGAQNYSSSLTVNSSSSNPMPDVTLQGTGLTAHGPITVYGGNINVNTNLTSTAANQDILLKGVNKITQAASTTIQTNTGDITLWSNTGNVTSGAGDFGIDLQSGSTINSSGGNITLGGGLDSDNNSMPDGYAYNGSNSWSSGVRIGNPTANATTVNLLSAGGNISVKGKGGGSTHGIAAQSNFKIDSGTGTIIMDGVSDGAWGIGLSHAWGDTDPNYAIVSSHTGDTAITISGTSTSGYGVVLGLSNANQIHYGNGLIQSSGVNGGIAITALTASTTNEGLLTMNGAGGNIQTNMQLLSAGGDISITSSGNRAAFNGNTYFGAGMNTTAIQGVTPLTSSAANLNLTFNNYFFDRTSQISTTGSLAIQPISGNTFNINGNNTPVNWSGTMSGNDFVIASGGGSASTNFLAPYNSTMTIKNIGSMTGLTIGNATNSADININSAISIAGPISLYGGNITLNAKLEATGTNTITLDGSGTVSDGASGYVVASNLLLSNGAVTLDHASNNIGTLAGSGFDSLTYIDSNALSIETVGSTSGLTSTGAVSIATKAGDLTLSKNISATSVTLNAGKDTAAGTSTGGNIIISGTPTITATTGNSKLYSGSITGSTGLTTLIGSGSGNFRYNSDESTTNFTTVLGATGNYAIYREEPTASGTISSETITYGDANPTFSLSGDSLQNGDSSSGFTIASPAYSTANKLKAGSYTINASGLSGFGYNVGSVKNGALTVNTKNLTVTGITTSNKVYDALLTATLGGTATITALSGDTVTLGGTASGAFADKDVGTAKAITITGNTISGTDAGNYNLVQQSGLSADVTKADLTVTGLSTSNKTYDTTTTATLSGTAAISQLGTDDVTLSGTAAGAFADKNVGTAKAVTITGNTISGADIGNYNLVQQTGLTADIIKADLTVTGLTTSSKVYDGTTTATLSGTAAITALSSDIVTLGGTASGEFATKDVGTAKAITIIGTTISGTDAGNYNLVQQSGLSADITQATLTVTADNDARFYSQTDVVNYAGVSYSGFVNGETSGTAGLTGTLAVARTGLTGDGSTDAAGSYTLIPSGLSASNYTITNQTGIYTIVPAGQLLIKVTDVSNTYGTATIYAVSNAQYMTGTTVTTLANPAAGNTVILDGVTLNLAPVSGTYSSGNFLNVGSYQLGGTVTAGTPTNFSNTLVVVGSHTVAQKQLTPSASGITKTYDGTTAMSGVTIVLTGKETNDIVTVSGNGAFDSKMASTGNKSYTLSGVTLSGADSTNYYLSGGTSFTGNDGTITQKDVTVSYTAANKIYDGTANATVTNSTSDIISGDTVTISESATFADKNVGAGKTVSISTIALGGADAANYHLTATNDSKTADITRLNSVTWIGGATGNWFDPANWAGGAVPDLSNVANVVIPTNVTVTFNDTSATSPAQAGTVNIDSLGSSTGSLTMTNGTLNAGSGGITLDTLSQSGGTITSTSDMTLGTFAQTAGSTTTNGNFTTTDSFSQGTTGSVSVGGNTAITDTADGIVLGNISTTGTTTVTSTGGDITQANGTVITNDGTTTLNASNGATKYNITLDGDNDFQSTVNADGINVTLKDTVGGLILGNIATTQNFSATTGNITQTTGSTISVAGATTLIAGGTSSGNGTVTLGSTTNTFGGPVNITASAATIGATTAPTFGTLTGLGTPTVQIPVTGPTAEELAAIEAVRIAAEAEAARLAAIEAARIATEVIVSQVVNSVVIVPVIPSMTSTISSNTALATSPMQTPQIFNSGGQIVQLSGVPLEDTPMQLVGMQEARAIMQGSANGDLRIPLGENSLIQLINGGVRLPEGVEQEFFMAQR